MRVVDNAQMEGEVAGLLSQASCAKIAVAFWGNGALERFIRPAKTANPGLDIQIICNLSSGGCNPNEISKIRDYLGTSAVLNSDRLHAKVWYTDVGVIIGSSNVSSNGMTLENDEVRGLIELNVFMNRDEIAGNNQAKIESWLKAINPTEITAKQLKDAAVKWGKRRRLVGGEMQKTMLEMRPEELSGINVLVWTVEGQLTERQREANQEMSLKCGAEVESWRVERKFDCPLEGTLIIEIDTTNNSVQAPTVWRVLGEVTNDGKVKYIFATEVKNKRVEGLKLGRQSAWKRAVKLALKDLGGEINMNLEEFHKKYIR